MKNSNELKFRVSSALKSIIGKDLITDKYIAVFELVKNGYDANASEVTIEFENIYSESDGIIRIIDNGNGMSIEDIEKKWLFVAYSEKNPRSRDFEDYRDSINNRKAAGAKGVGRFSCDRLGAKLNLYSRVDEISPATKLTVNWDLFEEDDSKEFIDVSVFEEQVYSMPKNLSKGTVLEITDLRETWDRKSLIKLKQSLMKLVNPETDDDTDPFKITIIAPDEKKNDDDIKLLDNQRINGLVKNDVFEKLNIKSTDILVRISKDGKVITTELRDRNNFIFEIKEKNDNGKFSSLKNIEVKLFYLNQVAKSAFTRSMGTQPVKYGSVFVYKNGFRIQPFGDPGQDVFGIDKRKQQGYNRFLGTRDIMGRITISGENKGFIETSSRDRGFIRSIEVQQLEDFFMDKVLRPLERYVTELIGWGRSDLELTDSFANDVIKEFAGVQSNTEIIDIRYSPEILQLIKPKSLSESERTVKNLERLSNQIQNPEIKKAIRAIQIASQHLVKDNENLAKRAQAEENARLFAEKEVELRKNQVHFFEKNASRTVESLVENMHAVNIQADSVRKSIRSLLKAVNAKDFDKIQNIASTIWKSNEKIVKYSEFSISKQTTFKLKNQVANIVLFIKEYIDDYLNQSLHIQVNYDKSNIKTYEMSFDPVEIGLIIDNVISNAAKHKATMMNINIIESNNAVELSFFNNGKPISADSNDVCSFFELGFTTQKNGSGVGLYHIKSIVEALNGDVQITEGLKEGFELKVRLKK